MVLVRVYGQGTDMIIDREGEMKNMARMQGIGLGGKLYAAFNNGICYQFLSGEVLSQSRLWETVVWKGVAKAMATMHSAPLQPAEETTPCLWTRLKHFINCCNPICKPVLAANFPSKQELLIIAENLEEKLMMRTEKKDDVVFCHNDALLANVVIQEENVINFIDLEYGAPNFAAFDIANHFVEFVGCDGVLDYEKWLPGKSWRLDWVREYLTEKNKNRTVNKGDAGCGNVVEDDKVEALQARVELFMLPAHLLWAVWAVIQAENSTIDFDFADYAMQRLAEFRRWKSLLDKESKL